MKNVKFVDGVATDKKGKSIKEAQLQLPGIPIGFTECSVADEGAAYDDTTTSSGIQLKFGPNHADYPNGHVTVFVNYDGGTTSIVALFYNSACEYQETVTWAADLI